MAAANISTVQKVAAFSAMKAIATEAIPIAVIKPLKICIFIIQAWG
jgi:hypothetical protein